MQVNIEKDSVVRGTVTVLVLVVLALLLNRLSGVLLPFAVSFLVAYLLAPIVDFFQVKCRLKNRVLSVLVTLLLTIGVLVGAVAALAPSISRQAATLSRSVTNYVQHFEPSDYLSEEVQAELRNWVSQLDVEKLLNNPDVIAAIKEAVPTIGNWIYSGLSAVTGLAVVFVCLLYVIFLLVDLPKIQAHWLDYVPAAHRRKAQVLMQDLDKNMNGYFRGQGLIALIVGVLFAIGFSIIGLPMGVAMGLIIGVLNLVPYMQALGIPPCILLGLVQSAETGRPVWLVLLLIAIVFIVVQSIQDMVLTPKIMGNVTGMGPAAILLCLCVWGSLLGVLGMIVALPLTTLMLSYYQRYVCTEKKQPRRKIRKKQE